MSDLRECPFCQCANVQLRQGSEFRWAKCMSLDCAAEGPLRATEVDAIAAWNRRAPSADHVPDTGKMVAPPVVKDCLTTQAAFAAGAAEMREAAAGVAEAFPARTHGALATAPYAAAEQAAEEVAAAIRALPLPAGGSGWRPIETAPRDGKSILCYAPGTPDRAAVRRTDYWWIEKCAFAHMRPSQPYTKWQPLPAAPEEEEG